MKIFALIFMSSCAAALSQTNQVHVDTLQTLDGQTITNADVKKISEAFALVEFGGGGARMSFTNLPESVQKDLGYSPAKAAAETDAQNRKRGKLLNEQASVMTARAESEKEKTLRYVEGSLVRISDFVSLRGEISQVTTNGIFLTLVGRDGFPGDRDVFIQCPVAGLVDDEKWDGYCYKLGTMKSRDGTRTVEKFDTGLSYATKSDKVMRDPVYRIQVH